MFEFENVYFEYINRFKILKKHTKKKHAICNWYARKYLCRKSTKRTYQKPFLFKMHAVDGLIFFCLLLFQLNILETRLNVLVSHILKLYMHSHSSCMALWYSYYPGICTAGYLHRHLHSRRNPLGYNNRNHNTLLSYSTHFYNSSL